MEDELLTIAEVSKILKVNVGFVHKLRKAGIWGLKKMLRNPELWQQEHRRCRHGKYSSANGNKSSEKGGEIRYSYRNG